MLRPRSHSLNWAWMTTWYYLSIYWKCWPEFARSAAGPGGCWEALIKHPPCLVPSRETGSRMCAAEVRVKPSTCHQAVCTMGTRDPLRIDCPRCKAKPGQLYKSKTRIRMCHKEGRIRSRKPKKRRSSHWGRPYPEGKYCVLFSRHPKLMGDQGLLVSRKSMPRSAFTSFVASTSRSEMRFFRAR
jgi:hypothetical protein